MTAASKFFARATASMSCAELVHRNLGCRQALIWNFTKTLSGCCRYVLPIAILPVVLKWRRLNRSVLRESAEIFVEYSLAAWVMVSGGLTMMCVMRHLLGRFTYLTVLALPAFLSSSLCSLYASQKLVSMFAHGLFTMVIEVSVARGDGGVLRFVRDSCACRTAVFMLVNMALMRVLQQSTGSNLWFLQPVRRSQDINNNVEVPRKMVSTCCGKPMSRNCSHHILEDMYRYAKLGLGVELLKAVIGGFTALKANPLRFIVNLPRRVDCKLSAFLITYCGLYRYLNCLLVRRYPQSPQLGHLVASCTSGISYYLYPNTQLLAHAVAIATEMSWIDYLRNFSSDNATTVTNIVARLPIARFFYPLAFAYLLQVRIFYPWLAPQVLKSLMNQVTNYKDNDIMSNYHRRLFGGMVSDSATLYIFGLDRLPPPQFSTGGRP